MNPPDRANIPQRRPMNLMWRDSAETGSSYGFSKHYNTGGPEDEAGSVRVMPTQNGRFEAQAEHYDPYLRGHDNAWADASINVRTKHRAMIAGQALLGRLQKGHD
jgi:hypothetical protein